MRSKICYFHPQKLGAWSNLTCAYVFFKWGWQKTTNYQLVTFTRICRFCFNPQTARCAWNMEILTQFLLIIPFLPYRKTLYTPGSTNIAGWKIHHECRLDVFPIGKGGFPASYVSWSRSTVLYFGGGKPKRSNSLQSSPILNPKNVIINGEHRCCVLTMYLPMGSMWLVLGGGFKYFFVHPYLQRWSNLTNILIDKNSTGIGRADLRRHLAQKQVSLGDTDALRVARRAYNAVSIETLHLAFELWLCWCKTEVQFRFQVWPR